MNIGAFVSRSAPSASALNAYDEDEASICGVTDLESCGSSARDEEEEDASLEGSFGDLKEQCDIPISVVGNNSAHTCSSDVTVYEEEQSFGASDEADEQDFAPLESESSKSPSTKTKLRPPASSPIRRRHESSSSQSSGASPRQRSARGHHASSSCIQRQRRASMRSSNSNNSFSNLSIGSNRSKKSISPRRASPNPNCQGASPNRRIDRKAVLARCHSISNKNVIESPSRANSKRTNNTSEKTKKSSPSRVCNSKPPRNSSKATSTSQLTAASITWIRNGNAEPSPIAAAQHQQRQRLMLKNTGTVSSKEKLSFKTVPQMFMSPSSTSTSNTARERVQFDFDPKDLNSAIVNQKEKNKMRTHLSASSPQKIVKPMIDAAKTTTTVLGRSRETALSLPRL